MIRWHHLFGRILDDLYTGTSYQVVGEKDLSVKQQALDVAVIEVRDEGPFWPKQFIVLVLSRLRRCSCS